MAESDGGEVNTTGVPIEAGIITQEEVERIAENSELSKSQLMAALFEACGAKPKEIARRLGKSEQYVYQLRQKDSNYVDTVKQFYALVAKRIVNQATNIDELFNGQIGNSAATLIEIRDNLWAKDSDRIKASLAFLDRAPNAPKITQNTDIRQTVVQIPISVMQEMRAALGEDGSEESLGILDIEYRSVVEQEDEQEEDDDNANDYPEMGDLDEVEVRRVEFE